MAQKVSIKGKVEESREGVAPPLHLGVVAIEKGALESPLTKVANFYYFFQEMETMLRNTENLPPEPVWRKKNVCSNDFWNNNNSFFSKPAHWSSG